MFLVRKPDWMSEAVWRSIRTAVEVAGAIFATQFGLALLRVLEIYQETHVFSWGDLWYSGVVAGVASIIAFALNRRKPIS